MSWFDDLSTKSKDISNGAQFDVSFEGIANSCATLGMTLERIDTETALLGTPKDNPMIRSSLKNNRKDATAQKEKLEQIMKLVEKKNSGTNVNKEQKYQFSKVQKQVEDVLKSFKKTINKSLNREKQLEATSAKFKPASDLLGTAESSGSAGETASGDGQQQEQIQEPKKQQAQKFVLTEAAANTIETERAIERQKLEDLKRLQVDMNDLHQCYVDIKDMLEGQQEFIDKIQDNVETAAAHVEVGVEELKAVNNMTLCIIS